MKKRGKGERAGERKKERREATKPGLGALHEAMHEKDRGAALGVVVARNAMQGQLIAVRRVEAVLLHL
jgi:hypothetical protein